MKKITYYSGLLAGSSFLLVTLFGNVMNLAGINSDLFLSFNLALTIIWMVSLIVFGYQLKSNFKDKLIKLAGISIMFFLLIPFLSIVITLVFPDSSELALKIVEILAIVDMLLAPILIYKSLKKDSGFKRFSFYAFLLILVGQVFSFILFNTGVIGVNAQETILIGLPRDFALALYYLWILVLALNLKKLK